MKSNSQSAIVNCQSIKSYFAIAGLYLLLLTVLKGVEYFLWDIDAPNRFQVFVNAVVYNLVVVSWVVLAAGLLYWLVQLLSRRVAVVLAAVFYAMLFLSEVGLLFYALHNGYLLGCELMVRPLSETLAAIVGAVGIVLPLLLSVLLVGGFIALALWRARRATNAAWAVPGVVLVFALLSLAFKPSHLVYDRFNHYILNKTHYLTTDIIPYLLHPFGAGNEGNEIPDYDAALVADLLATHPEWGTPADSTYPLERPFLPDTILNPYFNENDNENPNVVIIIVESLGHEFMGTGAMPFVDSLATTGLYWSNCLSATTRSYGAIPAITGSLGGPRSFQFGTMPAHNSLISLLKAEGYSTRAYYAGDFSFDCIYDYLVTQRIDYLSPLYEEFDTLPLHSKPNWWGYHDDTLFSRTLADLSRLPADTPYLSLLTTLSMHDRLILTDTALQRGYERRAAQLPPTKAIQSLGSACLFTDDCLRAFIRQYSRRPDFQNTLFVITGDHACGKQEGDKLSYHHVPLILWSPLVKHPARFNHLVTHNDVAPALYSLLTTKYGLPAQPTVHWLGDGLGPTPKTLLVVDYAKQMNDIIFHNHYYQSENVFNHEVLYTFGPDLTLQPDDNPSLLDSCRRQFALMRYLYNYTYLANRLTRHPVDTRSYCLIHHHLLSGFYTYTSPDNPPGTEGVNTTVLPNLRLQGTEGYSSVRIIFEASCKASGITDMHQYPQLHITFLGDTRHEYYENLYRLFDGDGRIKAIKEFSLSPSHSNAFTIRMCSPTADDSWKPGASVTLSDIQISIEYGK